MEKMQEYINYIFYDLWCEAPRRDYKIELFNGNTELLKIINHLYGKSTKSGDFFTSKIEEIYEVFKTLSNDEIDKLKKGYLANNDIEKLCSNDPSSLAMRYNELNHLSSELSNLMKKLFMELYNGITILNLAAVKLKIGTIDEHYKCFIKENKLGICPFCGLCDIEGGYSDKREAYDHYLPKSKYPFNSINFKNLAPMCHKCNSSNKSVKDPIHDDDNNRRKAFYIYDTDAHEMDIKLTLNNNDIGNLEPDDIEIEIDAVGKTEEVETWKDVFGIEQRYKNKCASSNSKYWYMQIIEESANYGKTRKEFLKIKINEAEKNPFFDTNFLRKPFLEACERKGLFEVMNT